ncbi:MAG: ATP-binding cassette domain-containing protein, partial [Rhodospirillaceae bacterium]|nr:ATP-binding cassette domain-containing protein [Rhodospirillaceae bacterium]
MFQGKDITCIRGERLVFTGLDFSVGSGGALVLIGPNGSGKSSLLRMMAGLLRPASGKMEWNGENALDDFDEHASNLHYVGHHDAVKPVLSVLENVRFWAGVRGGEVSDKNILTALDAFAAKHLADIPGRFLSAGQ